MRDSSPGPDGEGEERSASLSYQRRVQQSSGTYGGTVLSKGGRSFAGKTRQEVVVGKGEKINAYYAGMAIREGTYIIPKELGGTITTGGKNYHSKKYYTERKEFKKKRGPIFLLRGSTRRGPSHIRRHPFAFTEGGCNLVMVVKKEE